MPDQFDVARRGALRTRAQNGSACEQAGSWGPAILEGLRGRLLGPCLTMTQDSVVPGNDSARRPADRLSHCCQGRASISRACAM